MPHILLPHFISPPSLPCPAPLNTLLSHFSGFLHSHPLLVLPPSFTASLLPSLSLAQYSKSLPIATKGKTTTQHSSLRRPEHGIPSEKTQKPGKGGKANSETRKKSEESMDISRGRDELVSQGNLVGFVRQTDTFTDPTQTQKSKFSFLGEGAGSGSPVHRERAPAYSAAKDRDNCTEGRKQKSITSSRDGPMPWGQAEVPAVEVEGLTSPRILGNSSYQRQTVGLGLKG